MSDARGTVRYIHVSFILVRLRDRKASSDASWLGSCGWGSYLQESCKTADKTRPRRDGRGRVYRMRVCAVWCQVSRRVANRTE